jgi:hypothetical protein
MRTRKLEWAVPRLARTDLWPNRFEKFGERCGADFAASHCKFAALGFAKA